MCPQFDFLHSRGSSHGHARIIRRTYPEVEIIHTIIAVRTLTSDSLQSHYAKMMHRAYTLWDSAEKEAGFGVITRTGSTLSSSKPSYECNMLNVFVRRSRRVSVRK